MFIAWESFFIPKLRRSAIAFDSGIVTVTRFAPKGARSLGRARSYKHFAPLERNANSTVALQTSIHLFTFSFFLDIYRTAAS